MDNERSYDSLPNFTAADCRLINNNNIIIIIMISLGLRLLGIGRNQYIDLMNTGRTKSVCSLYYYYITCVSNYLGSEVQFS